jgi:hypothetical protein
VGLRDKVLLRPFRVEVLSSFLQRLVVGAVADLLETTPRNQVSLVGQVAVGEQMLAQVLPAKEILEAQFQAPAVGVGAARVEPGLMGLEALAVPVVQG